MRTGSEAVNVSNSRYSITTARALGTPIATMVTHQALRARKRRVGRSVPNTAYARAYAGTANQDVPGALSL